MNFANLMQGMGPNLLDAVGQGVLWGIMVLGVYITFKLLDIADLTVDGSFALGGCVCATLIVGRGMKPVAALFIATLAGMAAGFVTGILHTVFEIPSILAGILTQISLWSINLWIMGGSSNIPLLKSKSIVTMVSSATGFNQAQASQVIGIAVAILMVVVMYWFFGTELGCAIRATGNNRKMVRAQGVNTDTMKIIGLVLSNGLVGLAGGLLAQYQGSANINMGRGAIVIGLASVIIGEVIFGARFNFAYQLGSIVAGSVIYQIVIAFVLQLGLSTEDLKLFSAVTVALALSVPALQKKFLKSKFTPVPAGKE